MRWAWQHVFAELRDYLERLYGGRATDETRYDGTTVFVTPGGALRCRCHAAIDAS